MNANLIETARRSILSAGIQSEDYPGIGLFVSHHIDELSADYWMNQTGTAKPSADAILNLLEAMEIDDEEADLDEEGEMVTREVNGKFVNGKPSALEATYTWKTEQDFERFMRFAERYAETKGLGYSNNSGDNEAADEASEG